MQTERRKYPRAKLKYQITIMCEGKVLREGASSFLVNDEMSRELYLGPRFSM